MRGYIFIFYPLKWLTYKFSYRVCPISYGPLWQAWQEASASVNLVWSGLAGNLGAPATPVAWQAAQVVLPTWLAGIVGGPAGVVLVGLAVGEAVGEAVGVVVVGLGEGVVVVGDGDGGVAVGVAVVGLMLGVGVVGVPPPLQATASITSPRSNAATIHPIFFLIYVTS